MSTSNENNSYTVYEIERIQGYDYENNDALIWGNTWKEL